VVGVVAGGGGAHVDALVGERALDDRGDGRVGGGQEPLGALHDGDAGAEAGEHLRGLAAHVAAADHDQVVGDLPQVQHRARRQVGDPIQPLDGWDGVAGAGVEKDAVRSTALYGEVVP